MKKAESPSNHHRSNIGPSSEANNKTPSRKGGQADGRTPCYIKSYTCVCILAKGCPPVRLSAIFIPSEDKNSATKTGFCAGLVLLLCWFFGNGRIFLKHLNVPEKYLKTSTKPRFGPKKNEVKIVLLGDFLGFYLHTSFFFCNFAR